MRKQEERKRALTIVGYYGFGNLGDEVLRGILEDALGRAGFSPLFILVHKPDRPGEVDRADPLAVFKAMRRSSSVLFGGGGLLQNRTSRRSLAYYLSLVLLARAARRPVFLLGQGIGPIEGRLARQVTRLALRRVRCLGCRDEGSLAIARSLGLSPVLEGDLLFLLPPLLPPPLEPRRTPRRVILALKGTERRVLPRDIVNLVALLRGLEAQAGASVALLVSFPDQDLALAQALALAVGPRCRIVLPRTVDEATGELLGADLVIASRLHALELALRAGAPLLALGEDPKIIGFVHEVESLSGVKIPWSSSLALAETLSILEAQEEREPLLGAYRALHERARRSFALAVETLKAVTGGDG